jgi:hypothetical protein
MMLEYIDATEIRLFLNNNPSLPYYEITRNKDGTFLIRSCNVSEFAPVADNVADLKTVRKLILDDVSKEIYYQLERPEILKFFGIRRKSRKIT